MKFKWNVTTTSNTIKCNRYNENITEQIID